MSKTVTHRIRVEFGDCDPAGIVWFPNYFRWIDAASRQFFVACGLPRWADAEAQRGILGTPIVGNQTRFLKTASYGDWLDIHVHIPEWRDKGFVQHHRVTRARPDGGEDDILQCQETRIFASRRNDGLNGIRAVPVPADWRAMCE